MVNIKNRTVIEIVIAVWIIIAVGYLTHTPFDYRAHDISGHLEYTKIIFSELRLPHPYEGWETFQPPLYYLINSLIAPPHNILEAFHHIIYVRYLSVFYGLISILVIAWFLMKIDISPFYRMLVLLFIVTTPKFVFMFSSYNNDSLATMLSVLIVGLSYKLFSDQSMKYRLLLLLVATLAPYAKYTALLAILSVLVFCSRNLLKLKLPNKNQIKTALILVTSLILFLPWAYFHNYLSTGKLLPTNVENREDRNISFTKLKHVVGVIFRVPQLLRSKFDYTHEWDSPWVYPSWGEIHPVTKRYDYFAFVLITSAIGECIYRSPNVIFFWIILFIHFLIHPMALSNIFRSDITKLSALIIFFTHAVQISQIILFPTIPGNMDYRYIAWSWVAWAVLYSYLLTFKNKVINYLIASVFLSAILLQIYILFTIEGGYWY